MTQDLSRLGEINALLGRGTEYEGRLCFEGRVRVDGKFRGEIHSDDTLIVGEGADIDAVVHVARLIMRGGTLRGRVVATQLVELFAPSRVLADLETPLFFVERGVTFEGRCTMGEGPDASDVRPRDLPEPSERRTYETDVRTVGVPVPDDEDDARDEPRDSDVEADAERADAERASSTPPQAAGRSRRGKRRGR